MSGTLGMARYGDALCPTRANPSGGAASPCLGFVHLDRFLRQRIIAVEETQGSFMTSGPCRPGSWSIAPASMRHSSTLPDPDNRYITGWLKSCRLAASLASELAPRGFRLDRACRSAGLLQLGLRRVRPVRTRPYTRARSFWRRPCAGQCR
jgi:hypothetical protein